MIDIILNELTTGLPDTEQAIRTVFRVLVATVFAAAIEFERERTRKPAGLRTHMLVGLSSAVFVLAATESEMVVADVSRVIQGVATGIGFLGAGAILKVEANEHIKGLTTAAGIWMTAAVGVAAGLGRFGLVIISVVLGLIILGLLNGIERALRIKSEE